MAVRASSGLFRCYQAFRTPSKTHAGPLLTILSRRDDLLDRQRGGNAALRQENCWYVLQVTRELV